VTARPIPAPPPVTMVLIPWSPCIRRVYGNPGGGSDGPGYREIVAPIPLLEWVLRLEAIARNGLTFATGPFDRQRYEQVRRLAAEMAAHPGDPAPVEEVFAGYSGYATPLIICRAAVFDEAERILMVREAADGRWTLPGGWIDIGESPSEAAEREVREETGYVVTATKLAAVYDKRRHPHPVAPHHAYLMFFLCDLEGGEKATSVETEAVEWFEMDELPELSTGRATADQIRRMLDHRRRPDLPTDFD
jgi:ADP-ribose pyrophosphatase YjhB (NUDIX family)